MQVSDREPLWRWVLGAATAKFQNVVGAIGRWSLCWAQLPPICKTQLER